MVAVPSLFAALSVSNGLYTSVFKEYLYSILSRNTPLEYFIEGGRSRTGRLITTENRHARNDSP